MTFSCLTWWKFYLTAISTRLRVIKTRDLFTLPAVRKMAEPASQEQRSFFSILKKIYNETVTRDVIKKLQKVFAKFTRKHLCQSFFFNQVIGLIPAAF